MKILYVILSVVHFAASETTIKNLCAHGHTVEVLFDPVWSDHRDDYAIRACMAQTPGITRGWTIKRQDQWLRFLINSRELLSYASYLNRTEQSEFYLKRQEGYLYRPVRWLVRNSGLARALVATGLTQSLLRAFERLGPPYSEITRWLKNNRPDIVVVSPGNIRFSPEIEYIKAAKSLGIPTVIPVISWDNLTTKELFHIIPDITLAWNKTQHDEATRIHKVPPDKIVITGAPIFDRWLNVNSLGISREDFCRKVGLDAAQPYVVYLGSSVNIAVDETWLVLELAQCLRRHPNPEVRNINILVRPHPGHAAHYKNLKEAKIVVWPQDGALPDYEESLKDFLNTLRHGIATIGINNSAMLEAIINDRPCLTIITEKYMSTQQQAGHFQRLLDFDVLEISRSAEEYAGIIERILRGQDSKKQARHRFTHDFIRPRGLDISAGSIAARAIELAALGKSAAEINSELDSSPDK